MIAIFEFFGFIVILLVLCLVALFIYKVIGSKKTAGKIFLVVSSILILHLLLLFLLIFDPALLPSFLTKYAAKCSEWIFKLIFWWEEKGG
jgi:hypothetical protein